MPPADRRRRRDSSRIAHCPRPRQGRDPSPAPSRSQAVGGEQPAPGGARGPMVDRAPRLAICVGGIPRRSPSLENRRSGAGEHRRLALGDRTIERLRAKQRVAFHMWHARRASDGPRGSTAAPLELWPRTSSTAASDARRTPRQRRQQRRLGATRDRAGARSHRRLSCRAHRNALVPGGRRERSRPKLRVKKGR